MTFNLVQQALAMTWCFIPNQNSIQSCSLTYNFFLSFISTATVAQYDLVVHSSLTEHKHRFGLGPNSTLYQHLRWILTYDLTKHSPLAKQKRGLGLGLVEWGGGAADDDGGPRVPSQTLLEDTGQLAVSVRDVALLSNAKNNQQPTIEKYIEDIL